MKESIFLNNKHKIKIRAKKENRKFLDGIKESKQIFKENGTDFQFDGWCSNKSVLSKKTKINLYFEQKYLDFLIGKNILEKIGRIEIELYAIKQAFDYIDQYWIRRKNKTMPRYLFFNYVYNLTVNFIYIRLRSLIDEAKKDDNASITNIIKEMQSFVYGINVCYKSGKTEEGTNTYINSYLLLNSYEKALNNKNIQDFMRLTNKLYKHLTTDMANNKAKTVFLKVSKRSIKPLKELYVLFDYLKNTIYKSIFSYLIPGNDYAKYPQLSKYKMAYCGTEYGTIFEDGICPDELNHLLDNLLDGLKLNGEKEQQKRKQRIEELDNIKNTL